MSWHNWQISPKWFGSFTSATCSTAARPTVVAHTLSVSLEELFGEGKPAARGKRGPTPKWQQQIEALAKLAQSAPEVCQRPSGSSGQRSMLLSSVIGVCRGRRCRCWRARWVSVADLIGKAPGSARKRGPAPKLLQHLERISSLPNPRQCAVMDVLEALLAQQAR